MVRRAGLRGPRRRAALAGAEEAGPLRDPLRRQVVLVDEQLDQLGAELLRRPVAQQRHRARGHAAPARRRRHPVADLGVAALAVDLHHAEGADQLVAVEAEERGRVGLLRDVLDVVHRVLAGVRRRDVGPAAGSRGPGRPRRSRRCPRRGGAVIRRRSGSASTSSRVAQAMREFDAATQLVSLPSRRACARCSGSPPPCSSGRRPPTRPRWRSLRRLKGSPPVTPTRRRRPPARQPRRRGLQRGGGDRGEGRERARARLAARAARGDRRRRRRR